MLRNAIAIAVALFGICCFAIGCAADTMPARTTASHPPAVPSVVPTPAPRLPSRRRRRQSRRPRRRRRPLRQRRRRLLLCPPTRRCLLIRRCLPTRLTPRQRQRRRLRIRHGLLTHRAPLTLPDPRRPPIHTANGDEMNGKAYPAKPITKYMLRPIAGHHPPVCGWFAALMTIR